MERKHVWLGLGMVILGIGSLAVACARSLLGGNAAGGERPMNARSNVHVATATRSSTSARPSPAETARPRRSLCVPSGSGSDYVVAPGLKRNSLADVPWSELAPGDSVRVHWRAEPYRHKILVSSVGTKEEPVLICGVPGPSGQRPVLDGDGAVSVPGVAWHDWQGGGIIVINRSADQPWEAEPAHIVIQGFELRGARSVNKFRAIGNKAGLHPWEHGAAGIVIYRGDHVTLRDNVLHDNDNGIFTKSDGPGPHLIEDLLVEGNHIYNNGTEGRYYEHNTYIQAARVTYQYNRYGPLREGSGGTALKDRSPRTVVRYNWIEGGSHALDLVEAQEHIDAVKDDPEYHVAYVYGNVIRGKDAGSIVHFGGENAVETMRRGPLYFYHNTVYVESSKDAWRTTVFDVTQPQGEIRLVNNVFHRTGGRDDAPGIELMFKRGIARLGVNWIDEDWVEGHEVQGNWTGTITGKENLVTGSDPGLSLETMRPVPGSPLLDRAAPLDAAPFTPAVAHDFPLSHEYVPHATGRQKWITGKGPDIGALELVP